MAASTISQNESRGYSTETWMSTLPQNLLHCPLNKLAIPGSHNSGAFTFDETAGLPADAPEFLQGLSTVPGVDTIAKSTMTAWSKCQKLDFSQQLNNGVRYFDLRVSTKPGCVDFYLVHSMYGPKVKDLVETVLAFLEEHLHEVVMLDFNHFYSMKREDHQQLVTYLSSEFGTKLCYQCDCSQLSLQHLWAQGKQVILFYQHQDIVTCQMWPSSRICSLWANTTNKTTCLKYLENFFHNPSQKDFNVCQGVLTPTTDTVLKGLFFGDNLETMNKSFLPSFCAWLRDFPKNCHYPLNIVTSDFVDSEEFIQTVVDLNYLKTRPLAGVSYNE